MSTEIVTSESLYPWTEFDRALDELRRNLFGTPEESGLANVRTPRLDIEDAGPAFKVFVELPGFSKEEIHLAVKGPRVDIRAEHGEKTETSTAQFLYRERSTSSFQRSFELPEPVVGSEAKATVTNGVLLLELPKLHPSQSTEVSVPVQ